MLFMITMTHDYSTCQTHDPESLSDHGLKIHANYVNRLEHKGYMVVEADSFEQIDAAFDPVLEMGHFEVTPVMQR
jgi:hypothetical protein